MSAVYLAHRADGQFDHKVAVKVMAGYLAGPEFLRKFETERQVLAALHHDHITRLLDGGVSSAGDPYLITEYVEGETIDRYCDRHKLDVEARLRIFLQVCEAVDYAHRNLIVHRDLKPGNIMVNAEGSVKLLDFGTASLASGDGDVTVTRLRLLTPRYASPEQLRGQHVNTSTDIFSLGVVLYELLCGAWPFGDPNSVLSELNRAADNIPAKPPSTAVTAEAAANRSISREQLSRTLKGDLSPILMRALENEPARRYASVRQFADDVENFLERRPVRARPQTMVYRSGKFVRRRWLPVSAAALFVIGLLGAALIALYEARLAQGRYADLRSLTTMLLFELKDAITDVPGSTPAQRILVTRVVKSLDQMAAQSAQDSKLRLDLAEAYRQLGELQASPYVQNLGDTAGALTNLKKARSLAAEQLTLKPGDLASLKTVALVDRTIGEVDFGAGKTKDAVANLVEAATFLDRMVQSASTVPALLEAAITHQLLGDVYGQPGTASLSHPGQAAPEYRRAIGLDQEMFRKDPHMWRALRGIGLNRMKLGDLYAFSDPEKALDEYQQALRANDELPPEERNRPANIRFRAQYQRKIGGGFRDLQQWADSEQFLNRSDRVFEDALAADPEDARAKYDVVVILEAFLDLYDWQGNTARASEISRRLVSLMGDLVAKDPANQSWSISLGYHRYRLATLLARAGDQKTALSLGTAALSELRRIADQPDAAPQALVSACEAYARIEPLTLRDGARAVVYAGKYAQVRQPDDASALYYLAIALNARGPGKDAAQAAQKALAALAPPQNGRGSYRRTELEAITSVSLR